ncbi:MAG: hypothetical protein P8Y43_09125, partial [Sulfurovaceae bacterium]
ILKKRGKDEAEIDCDIFLERKHVPNFCKKNNKELLFAINGGMYEQDLSPQGLYIEQGKMFKTVNRTQEAYGNFYNAAPESLCDKK